MLNSLCWSISCVSFLGRTLGFFSFTFLSQKGYYVEFFRPFVHAAMLDAATVIHLLWSAGVLLNELREYFSSRSQMMLELLELLSEGVRERYFGSMLKPMLVKVASELGSSAAESFDPFEIWTIERLHEQLDDLLKQKLLELTPEMVKDMMEAMMRKHCTWLVVWGNLFGGLIGVGAHYVGYA